MMSLQSTVEQTVSAGNSSVLASNHALCKQHATSLPLQIPGLLSARGNSEIQSSNCVHDANKSKLNHPDAAQGLRLHFKSALIVASQCWSVYLSADVRGILKPFGVCTAMVTNNLKNNIDFND